MAGRPNKHDVCEAAWQEALRREAVIRPLAGRSRLTLAAVDAAAEDLGLKRARIYRLIAAYRAQAMTSALVPPRPGSRQGSRRLDSERESLIEEAIERVYRSRQKPSIAALVDHIAHECRRRRMRAVSRKAVEARIRTISPKTLVRDRQGSKAAGDRFRPVRTTYHADYALQIVQIDHTKLDVFVVDEAERLPIGRPWLTLAIDIASRMVAGFYLSLEAPSASAVALALHHTVLPKEAWLARLGISAPWPVTGVMDVLHMDNGKEFHSRALARGAGEYGISLVYRPPATPRFGGHIERLIGTMVGAVHLLPGTTFSSVEERGAYDPEKHAAMTLTEVEKWLAIQIVGRYHADIHATLLKPPDAMWLEALAARPEPPRQPPDPEQFLYDFLPFELRRVRRDGLVLFNAHYWDDILSVWAGQLKERLRVKYDPRDLSRVYLEAPDGKHWPIRMRDLGRPPITLWESRAARQALRAKGRGQIAEQMIFDAVEAQRLLVAEALARTKAARRAAQRAAYAVAGAHGIAALAGSPAEPPLPGMPVSEASIPPALPYAVEEWS
jgi:putative transposase